MSAVSAPPCLSRGARAWLHTGGGLVLALALTSGGLVTRPKPGPPDGPYHVCSGIMPTRGVNRCPDGRASPHARRSVRVHSEDTFSINDFGDARTLLFAADIAHAPTGCGVWCVRISCPLSTPLQLAKSTYACCAVTGRLFG